MRISRRTSIILLLVFSAVSVATVAAEGVIAYEVNQIEKRLSPQGFTCRTERTGQNSGNIDLKLQMSKDVLYYIAVVTGRGETVVHPASVTLINQNRKVIPLEVQNLEFGSVLQLHPLSDGPKTLKFAMKQKTDYALEVCTNKASLFHTEEKNSVFENHGHF